MTSASLDILPQGRGDGEHKQRQVRRAELAVLDPSEVARLKSSAPQMGAREYSTR